MNRPAVLLCTNCDQPTGKPFANALCDACDEIVPVTIYILCYGRPTLVKSRDYLRSDTTRNYPITHYVGMTRQKNPMARVTAHGPTAREAREALVELRKDRPLSDEQRIKHTETCPRCGGSLFYYAESPTYLRPHGTPRT